MRVKPESLIGKFVTNCCVLDMWRIDTPEQAEKIEEALYQQDNDEDYDELEVLIADNLYEACERWNSGQSESEIESIKSKFS